MKCFVSGAPVLHNRKQNRQSPLKMQQWVGFLYLHLPSGRGVELCYYPKSAERKAGITPHSQGFSPCWTASPAFSYLFWGCTEGHGVPQGGGNKRRMALGGAVAKPEAMISQVSGLLRLGEQRHFSLDVQLSPAHRTGLTHWCRDHSSLSPP